MITFYKADETDFDNNGLGVLDHDIQNPDIEEKLNDIFTFSFNYPIFGVNGSRLAARMIVKADDPENEGQLFRIMKLSKSNGMLTAFCYHIFYDLNGNEIPDTNIVGQNGQTAITQMLSKTAVAHKFQGFSDIVETANIRVVRMSPVKFLIDPQTDNNFINRLGGEIRRVNYRIWMNKVRGSDNGATIRWKKSLDSYNATWDYTTIATRIRPVGYNGIMLPESYVDSPLIDKYETIVIKEIQYSDIKAIDPNATSNDETAVPLEEAYELLRQAAAKEFSGNNLDKPTVTLSVNMVALRNMDEYKDVKSLETINPWDTVTVINERDGLSVKVRLNHYHWNPVTRKFISMELGNSKSSFTDIVSKVDHANDVANQANDTANTAAESANGKNSNYYGPSEPSRPVDGDLWYKKNGDKTELWQYDGKSVPPGWKLVVDDATGEEVRQNVDAAQKEAEEAKTQANKAVDGANEAMTKAGFANDTAEEAKSDAAAATQNATTALTNAGTALTNAKNALDNVTKLDQTVKTEVTNINGQLAQKVNQITFDTLKGTVTSQGTIINQNKDAIKLKADQTYVDTIKGTVENNTAAINLNSKEIKLKANQSDVDKLGGRVTNTESQIKLQADQIKLTVSKTELTNILGDYATQTWTQSQIKSTADQINLSVSKVQSNLDSMHIGSRNYLKSSDTVVQLHGVIQTYPNGVQANGWYVRFQPIQRYTEDVWVFSTDYIPIAPTPAQPKLAVGVMNHEDANLFTVLGDFPVIDGRLVAAIDLSKVDKRFDSIIVYSSHSGWGDSIDKKAQFNHYQMERATTVSDWHPAPEDMATEVQFSQLQLTVNGIQSTVQNKADQSQVTQLANQITSVVGARNLVVDSGLSDINNTWSISTYSSSSTTRNDFWQSVDGGGAGYTLRFLGTNFSDEKWSYAKSRSLNARPYTKLSASVMVWSTDLDSGAALKIEFADSDGQVINDGVGVTITDNSKVNTWQTIKAENVAVPSNAATVRLTLFVIKNGNFSFLHPMMNIGAKALPYSASDFAQSQITQLANDINLRVQKGDIINQINISPESILIAGQKVHITGQTSIDNAVIKDAMIADIKADKITAGTLNAANVNVINLNANNITTGTIKGANLSMNLNTGEVAFQKGSIKSTNGNLNIRIDDGSMSLTNSLGNGAYFKDGNIYMTDSDFWTPGNPKIQYGTLKMVPNFLSDAGGGVALKGPNGVVVGTDEYSDTGFLGDLFSSISGGGITLTNEHVRIASEGDIGIAGGKMYNSGFGGELPAIQVGIAGSHTDPMPWFPSGEIGDALFLSGKVVGVVASNGTGNLMTNTISDLSASCDARSGYVLSAATYKRTYGSGDTVTITPNGVFGRISSASKYKLAIGEISTLTDEAHQFLSVKPKQWFDKSESEALADSMTTGNTDYVDDAKALPHNGFIAEDLYTAGLDSYVIRSNDGSIESIQYDRLPVLHHELIRELFNRLDAAEMEIYKLKQEVLNNAN